MGRELIEECWSGDSGMSPWKLGMSPHASPVLPIWPLLYAGGRYERSELFLDCGVRVQVVQGYLLGLTPPSRRFIAVVKHEGTEEHA